MTAFFRDKRNPVILLLSALVLIRIPLEGPRFVSWIFGGVLLTSLFDFLASAILQKKWVVPKGAVISGFIVSGILDYRQPIFALVIFSFLPVLSKHLLRFKNKHIFNPANFSLAVATLFKMPLSWNIESNIYLIIIAGLFIAYSLKKIPHLVGFFLFFIGLFSTQDVNPILMVSWFFVFIMLIEPKTSGFGNRRGFIFGGIAAISAFLVFRFIPACDFPIAGLFIANLFSPLLERVKN